MSCAKALLMEKNKWNKSVKHMFLVKMVIYIPLFYASKTSERY